MANHVTLKRDTDGKPPEPLHWCRMGDDEVIFADPHGHIGTLQRPDIDGHAIDEHGKVTPSILQVDCGWHVWATLEDWDCE